MRNVTSDLFQWPLTGVAQVPLFNLVAFFGFYSGCCEGGWGQGGEAGEIVYVVFKTHVILSTVREEIIVYRMYTEDNILVYKGRNYL